MLLREEVVAESGSIRLDLVPISLTPEGDTTRGFLVYDCTEGHIYNNNTVMV